MTTIPRALVVEDDRAWQQILAELLGDAGFAVDIASDARSARASVRSAPHRLAVVDLSLAGPDHRNREGLDVLDMVRRHDPGCTTVLLSGFATVELAVSALNEYGAYTCLRKENFRRRDFRQLLRDILARPPQPPSPPDDESAPVAAPQAPTGDAARILVVDDDAGWRSVLAELLSDAGYRVQTSGSYAGALERLQREVFALVVVDLALSPTAKGERMAGGRQLLGHAQQRQIPALVLSGMATPREIDDIMQHYQVQRFIEKQSFSRRAFLQAVAQVLQAAPPALTALTPREQEVLALLAAGLSNKAIAERLVISPNTVKRHTLALFAKLGVNNRAAAAAVYLRAVHSSPEETP